MRAIRQVMTVAGLAVVMSAQGEMAAGWVAAGWVATGKVCEVKKYGAKGDGGEQGYGCGAEGDRRLHGG